MTEAERDALLLSMESRLSMLESFVSDLGEMIPRSDHRRLDRLDGKAAGYTCKCGTYVSPGGIHGCAATGW